MYNVLFYVDTVDTTSVSTLYRMYQIYWVINTCIKCFLFHVDTVNTTVWNVLRSTVFMSTLSIHAFSAVRMVAAGHRMVTEGWTLFEKTCEEVGPGELPQLLRQLKSAMTPSPGPSTATTPIKTEPMEEEEEVQQPADLEASASGFIETPIMIRLGQHTYTYKCGNCDILPKTKRAMDAHICSAHTKKTLLCSFCHFTTYNMDSLQRHEKEHK